MTTDTPAFAHKTYRCEWVARVAMVDQYGRSVPREAPEYEQAWPTRELAQADLERVTTAHPVLGRIGKTAYSIGAVAYREVPVETEVTPEMVSAALSSQAKDDEGEFDPLFDLLGFSGENKSRTVMRAALAAALNARG